MSTLMKKLSLLAAEDEDSEEYWRSLTPEQQRRRQIQKGEERDHESRLVNNPKASPAALHTLALKHFAKNNVGLYNYNVGYLMYKIANHKNTHPNTLHLLSDSIDGDIRQSIIANPNTSLNTLRDIGVKNSDSRHMILKRLLHGPKAVEDL